jgi:hypothetical protein
MPSMIEDAKFLAEFEAFCDENGYGILGSDAVETRDTLDDFIESHGLPHVDEQRNGHRFVMIRRGRVDILVGDAGEARLAYVGR